MTRLTFVLPAILFSTACAVATGAAPGAVTTVPPRGPHAEKSDARKRGLTAFDSVQELRRTMASVTEARRVAREKEIAEWREECRAWAKSDIEIDQICSGLPVWETVTVASAAAVESITNTQHAGVDEGGIVKQQGDVLVVLRRGRLFTIGIGGGQLDSLDVADAFGPLDGDVETDHTWYDELLVSGRTVVVIGFSYSRGGTEIGLFDLSPDGHLQHRTTYHLRSDDYYSATNYASRLIGERLVLFSSLRLPENEDPDAWLPAIRRWRDGGSTEPFESIAPINRVFRPVTPVGADPVIHTLVSCNLAAPSLVCEATVLLGDSLTAYYSSPTAAYVWTTAWTEEGPSRSLLYRMPFDGAPVSAIGVTGIPPDQWAFFEDAQDHLNVVVAHPNDVVTLLRLPSWSFSDGSADAPDWSYRPIAHGLDPWFRARFVGPYVIVGAPSVDPDDETPRTVVVAPWAGESTFSLRLNHDVQRIEAMGEHAVVVGTGEHSLWMTAIHLGSQPAIAGTLAQPDAFQSEERSHGFFYRQDTLETGVFGLPIVTMNGERDDLQNGSARVLFVRNRALAFAPEGTLDASPDPSVDDHCRVSCLDWYGNARPIFVGDRIFALLGYEIVEGRLARGGVEEVRRLGFMPKTGDVR